MSAAPFNPPQTIEEAASLAAELGVILPAGAPLKAQAAALEQVWQARRADSADAPPLAAFPLTDLGNAERLVALHGRDLRYVPELGWLAWDRRRWRRDVDGEAVRRAKATVRALQEEGFRLPSDDDRKRIISFAIRSESQPRLHAAVKLAETDAAVVASIAQLDANPWTLTVANGTIDLTTGQLRPHDRRDLNTKLTPVAYDPAATAPQWIAFLERALGGDRDLIRFVQRAAGYSLTGSTREQVLFVLHGAGANGKSTFIESLRALLGDYGQQTPAETFLDRRNDGIPNDLARLPGARFVAAVETGEGRRLAETLVKRLTGGDTITARFLHREYFEFRPAFKAWLATNHLPEIRGTDHAIWRRVRLIPFTVTIPEHERDPDLAEKLRAELPGILAWAVRGCLDWQRHGLGAAAAVTAATAEYRSDMDVLGAFLEQRCELDPTLDTPAGDLYRAYLSWCDESGERDRLSQRAFGLRLAERGLQQTRTRSARLWRGIALRTRDQASPSVTPGDAYAQVTLSDATSQVNAYARAQSDNPENASQASPIRHPSPDPDDAELDRLAAPAAHIDAEPSRGVAVVAEAGCGAPPAESPRAGEQAREPEPDLPDLEPEP